MAKEYSFQYELVQYKWPRWLHQQTEKQRIIWGYKILFLDVLFPLVVDKFLFVDADQVRCCRPGSASDFLFLPAWSCFSRNGKDALTLHDLECDGRGHFQNWHLTSLLLTRFLCLFTPRVLF